MTTDTIYHAVYTALGLRNPPMLTSRTANILRHYQRWYDRSAQSRHHLDFATQRCLADLAGRNGTDPTRMVDTTEGIL